MEEYMRMALHDPDHGYYSTRIKTVGSRGDFSTAATLSSTLAKALAAEYKKLIEKTGIKFPIIEIGAGDGSLALAFRRELGFWARRRTPYIIIDSSPSLCQIQRERLGTAIIHHSSLKGALETTNGDAFIFSNELVDAFPARIFQANNEGEWSESGLSTHAHHLIETPRHTEFLPPSSLFEEYNTPGQRVEVHDSYRLWCKEWADLWKRGLMITVDYGGTIDKIYYRRPWGTFRGYHAHRPVTGINLYRAPGKIDMTCDVNFTDLIQWGEKNGWRTLNLLHQKDFLLPYSSQSEADQFLSHPHGAGTAFLVLIQSPSEN